MEISVAIFDQVLQNLRGKQYLRTLLVLENFLQDSDDVLGAQVGVVDNLHQGQHVINVEFFQSHDHAHVLDGCGVGVHILTSHNIIMPSNFIILTSE